MKFALVFVHLIMRYILGYLILGHPWSVSDLSIPCPNLSCSARCSPRLKKQPESAKCSSNSALNFLRIATHHWHFIANLFAPALLRWKFKALAAPAPQPKPQPKVQVCESCRGGGPTIDFGWRSRSRIDAFTILRSLRVDRYSKLLSLSWWQAPPRSTETAAAPVSAIIKMYTPVPRHGVWWSLV